MAGRGRKKRIFITLEPDVYELYAALLRDLGLTFSGYVEQFLIESLPRLTELHTNVRGAVQGARGEAKQQPLFGGEAEEKRLRLEVSRAVRSALGEWMRGAT